MMEKDNNSTKNVITSTILLDKFWLVFSSFVASPKCLVGLGIMISIGFIMEGLLCFTLCSANIRSYTLSFYYVVFGLFTITLELQFKKLAEHCAILSTFAGKGLWYLFLGTLSIGNEWWSILSTIFLLSNGMLNLTFDQHAGCAANFAKNKEGTGETDDCEKVLKYDIDDADSDDSDVGAENVNVELGKFNKNNPSVVDQDEQPLEC
eukprot:UN10842